MNPKLLLCPRPRLRPRPRPHPLLPRTVGVWESPKSDAAPHIGQNWCIASIIWNCAPLVAVARTVALGADHHFVHVVPNPLIFLSSNTLAHFYIWIWYVHYIFIGVLSKNTLHEVALNCSVPSVLNSFLLIVPWHVPTVEKFSNFITYNDHMCAQVCSSCGFRQEHQQIWLPISQTCCVFLHDVLAAFSPCTPPHISIEFHSQ
jgi:hypothetical protein